MGNSTTYIQTVKLKMKTHIFGRGQTWHRPEDVESALDKSLEDLGLDYGNVKTPAKKLDTWLGELKLIFFRFFFFCGHLVDLYLMHCKYSIITIFSRSRQVYYLSILYMTPLTSPRPSPVPHAYAAGPNNSTIRHSSGNGKVRI